MPRLSKKTMFAIEAVLDVAFHAGTGTVRCGDITEACQQGSASF